MADHKAGTPAWLKALYAVLATILIFAVLGMCAGRSHAATHYNPKRVAKLNARCDNGDQKACDWLYKRGLRTQ